MDHAVRVFWHDEVRHAPAPQLLGSWGAVDSVVPCLPLSDIIVSVGFCPSCLL